MLGYEEEEIKADEKQIKHRHLLCKQLTHSKKIKLKPPEIDMLASYCHNPAMPVGKIIPTPKKPEMWSEVTSRDPSGKKKTVNKFSQLI